MDNYINRIIDGDGKAFDQMYKALKPSFIKITKSKYDMDKSEAEDLYHESLAVLYNNVATGRLERDSLPDKKLRAYVLQIAKNTLFNKRRKRQPPLVFDPNYPNYPNPEDIPYDQEIDDKLFIIRETVRNMPNPCRDLLKLAIYEKKKNPEIASIMKYAKAASVKTQRSRCMTRLREKVKERFKMCGYE